MSTKTELLRHLKNNVTQPFGLFDENYLPTEEINDATKFLWRDSSGFVYELDYHKSSIGPFLIMDYIKLFIGTDGVFTDTITLSGTTYCVDKPTDDIVIRGRTSEEVIKVRQADQDKVFLNKNSGSDATFFGENEQMFRFCTDIINVKDSMHINTRSSGPFGVSPNALLVKRLVTDILAHRKLVYSKPGYAEHDVKDPTIDAAITVFREDQQVVCCVDKEEKRFDTIQDYCRYMCEFDDSKDIKLVWSF